MSNREFGGRWLRMILTLPRKSDAAMEVRARNESYLRALDCYAESNLYSLPAFSTNCSLTLASSSPRMSAIFL
jgi:hypothetical protein